MLFYQMQKKCLQNRSDKYQYKYREIICPDLFFYIYDDNYLYEKIIDDEEIEKITKQLYSEIEKLSNQEKDIIKLFLENYTQMEISAKLNISQGNISLKLKKIILKIKKSIEQGD